MTLFRNTVKWHRGAILLATVLLVALSGCATTPQKVGSDDSIAAQVLEPSLQPAPASSSPIELKNPSTHPAAPIKPEIHPGSGKFINEKAARAPTHGAEAPKGKVTFNFENEPIQAVVKAILGDLLQKNYIIAPGVSGNVTYATSQPVRSSDAMPILETLLSWTNNSLIFKDGRYTVLPTKSAIPGNLTPRLAPAQIAKGYEVRIFPLHYISPTEMQKLLKPFAPADAFVSVDTSRSLLIMAGTKDQLENYQRSIDIFDVDWLKGMSVGIYNMQNQDVAKLMPQLDGIFGAKGESPLAGMFRFIPVEATNSIIVITSQPEYLTRAQEWLLRLDAGGAAGSTRQIYIYDVKNSKSADLAGYLNEIFNGISYTPSTESSGNVAPGLTPMNASGSRFGGTQSNNQRQPPRRTTTTSHSSGGTATSGDGPRITSVDANNQLLVLATPSQWDTIQQAARRLDIAPLQVQIEVKILEVSLSGEFSFGVQWYLEGLIGSSSAGGQAGFAQPGNRQAWALGGASPATLGKNDSFFYSFINSELQVAVHAMESNGNVKTLSQPSLVVLNNQSASIDVGTQVPVVQNYFTPGYGAGTGTGNTGYQTGSVSYLDTGIQLQVTPRVNPGGLVYMDIDQEVSLPGATVSVSGNPPISKRSIQTQVAVQSGQTVLLGGLIKQDDTDSKSGVPLLSRIPWLGKLFSTTTRNKHRTELLVLITPHVITNSQEAREITREYQMRFQSLKPMRDKIKHDEDRQQSEHDAATQSPNGDTQ